MSEDKPESANEEKAAAAAPKKKSDTKLFLGIGALFLVMALMYGMSLGPLPQPETVDVEVAEEDVGDVEQAYGDVEGIEGDEQDMADDGMEVADDVELAESLMAASFDLDAAKKERILGDASAPIKIAEHSSFSCGHCGEFHKTTFAAFKEAYIDTGKAYLVFSDFPLNAPALHASMTARCIPEERYFDFAEALFADQENWAYAPNYLELLESKAAEFGLGAEGFKACVNNELLQNALIQRMKAVQGQWQVRSTPSFVVNNQVVVTGAQSFEDFDKAIQDALVQIEAENTEPAGSPETPDEGE